MEKFVVAHEYAYILAAHFDENLSAIERIKTRAGVADTLRKDWAQELEADTIAYKLLLGADDFRELNLAVMDKPHNDPEHSTGADWSAGFTLKSALVAPFIMLTISSFLETVGAVMAYARTKAPATPSHPSARTRMENLLPAIAGLDSKYSGFVNYAGILWAHNREISQRIVNRALKRAGIQHPSQRNALDSSKVMPEALDI